MRLAYSSAVRTFVLFLTLSGLFVTVWSMPTEVSILIGSGGSINYAMPWLHANGNQIFDEYGGLIILKGVNVYSESHTDDDYAKMRQSRVSVVRLPVEWNRLEPRPAVINLTYLEMIDSELGMARKYGIYIVLSMIQWYWSPHFTYFNATVQRGIGMPEWLVRTYPDSASGLAHAIEDFWLGRAANGTLSDLRNPSMQDRYISAWKYLAGRYRNESAIAGFDLFNEPFSSDYFGGSMTEDETNTYLYPFYSRLVRSIRELNAKHIVIYQPVPKIGERYSPQLLSDSNVVISPHIYDRKTNYDGNSSRLESFLEYARWMPLKDFGIPIWIGEAGIELFRPNSASWANDVLNIFSEHGFGWAWWVYAKRDYPGYSLLYSNGTEKIEITSIIKSHL